MNGEVKLADKENYATAPVKMGSLELKSLNSPTWGKNDVKCSVKKIIREDVNKKMLASRQCPLSLKYAKNIFDHYFLLKKL